MKFSKPTLLTSFCACVALALCATFAHAEELVLFDGEQTPFDNSAGGAFENWANVSGNAGFDAGGNSALMTDYGITLVDAVDNPFGTGNAMRIFDLAPDEKPEVQGEFGEFDMADPPAFTSTPMTEPFRIDIDFNNRNVYVPSSESDTDGNHAIRFRMANSGQSITSESRSAFSVSFQADGRMSIKYSGLGDVDGNGDPAPNPNDVDTIFTDPLVGPQTVTIVANGNIALDNDFITPLEGVADYTYTLFGQTRTLHSLHYDVYLNGVLVNDDSGPDEANGLQFHTERSTSYFADDGLGRFGLVGSSNSDTLPDYDMDNIVVRTGDDIEGSAAVVGDFDGDGDVDCADLDGYVGNIGAAATGALEALDIDDDGTISAADANTHITTLVMTSNGQTGTFPGDLNCDGTVNVLGDAFALVGNLGNAVTSYSAGDINFDGTVNVLGDAFTLIGNLGNSNAP
jgi:hypothetical protein